MNSAALLRRLDVLAVQRTRHSGHGVLLLPPISYDLSAWEQQAVVDQARLAIATREGVDTPRVMDSAR